MLISCYFKNCCKDLLITFSNICHLLVFEEKMCQFLFYLCIGFIDAILLMLSHDLLVLREEANIVFDQFWVKIYKRFRFLFGLAVAVCREYSCLCWKLKFVFYFLHYLSFFLSILYRVERYSTAEYWRLLLQGRDGAISIIACTIMYIRPSAFFRCWNS